MSWRQKILIPTFYPKQGVKTFIPGKFLKDSSGKDVFVPGKMINGKNGPKFVPGQVIQVSSWRFTETAPPMVQLTFTVRMKS